MELPPELKALLDIGLGGMSLLLWLRQGKVNKLQMQLDERQNKTTQDLTIMVKDHEQRLGILETNKHAARRSGRKRR